MPLVKEQARRVEPVLEHDEMVVSTFLKEVAVARHGEMLGSTPWAGGERGILENTVEQLVMSLGKTPGGKEVVSEIAVGGRGIRIPQRDPSVSPSSDAWKMYLAQEAIRDSELERIQREHPDHNLRGDRIWTSAVGTAANVLAEYISQTRSGEAVINHLAAQRVMSMAKAEGKTELAKLDELKGRFTEGDYGKLQAEINKQLAETQFKTLPGIR